jgi:hypothetical protein
MISFFSAILAAFLPRRYRSQWLELHGLLPAGAITGGLMELSLSVAVLALGYFNYFPGRAGDLTHMLSTHGTSGSFQAYGTRMFAMLEYLLRPTSLVLIYFALEGTIRLYAAVCTNEVLPTLPIFLIEWMHGRIERRRKEASLGPRLIDEVQTTAQTNSELRVASSRRKSIGTRLRPSPIRDGFTRWFVLSREVCLGASSTIYVSARNGSLFVEFTITIPKKPSQIADSYCLHLFHISTFARNACVVLQA